MHAILKKHVYTVRLYQNVSLSSKCTNFETITCTCELVAVNMEEQGLPSGASQGSLDPHFHKHLPAVLTVQPSALCPPLDDHLPPDDNPPPPDTHPPLPDDYPPLPNAHPPSPTDAHSPLSNVHPPLPDVHHERRPILAEPISCFSSHNPGKHMQSDQCCVRSEGTITSGVRKPSPV